MGASKQENSTEIGRSHWYSYISSMPSHPEHDRIRCNRQWQDCEDLDSGKMRIFFPPLAAEGNVLLDGWSFCIFPDPYPIDMLVVLIHLTTVHVLRVFDGTQLSKLFIYVIIVNSLDVITCEFQLWDISPPAGHIEIRRPGAFPGRVSVNGQGRMTSLLGSNHFFHVEPTADAICSDNPLNIRAAGHAHA